MALRKKFTPRPYTRERPRPDSGPNMQKPAGAKQVPCPSCGATAFADCVDPCGNVPRRVHGERYAFRHEVPPRPDEWLDGQLRDCDEVIGRSEQAVQEDRVRAARGQLTPGASKTREAVHYGYELRDATPEEVAELARARHH